MASSSSTSGDRRAHLSEFKTKISAEEDLGALVERYDIPTQFRLELPGKDQAAHEHGGDKAPLYVTHLEYGLRLPLPPFVRKLCERLGVSPMQLAPNAIAAIMAFLVICHRLRIEPSLQLFSHLFSAKANKKDPHFFFVNSGPRLVNFPESNKDWKEKFVWIFNADPILACPTWPEIRKDVLKAIPLSASERVDLARIKQYKGSRDKHNLFDPAVLREAGLSPIPPTDEDRETAKELAAVVAEPTVDKEAAPSETAASEPPLKKPRVGLSKEEKKHWATAVDTMASMLIEPNAPSAAGAASKKKKGKGPKKPVPKKMKSKAETSAPDEAAGKGASSAGLPQGSESSLRPAVEVITLDEASPRREETAQSPGRSAPVVGTSDGTQQGEAETRTHGAVSGSAAGQVISDETGMEAASSGPLPEDSDPSMSFRHSVSEIGRERWRELRSLLIGDLHEGFKFGETSRESDKFAPRRPLYQDDSVFLSGRAQIDAIEQFSLPRDVELLREVPSSGLHLAMASYFTRGALMSEELFLRTHVLHKSCGRLEGELAQEKETRDRAEKRVAALEAELREVGPKWEAELEKKQLTISNVRTHCAKLSAVVNKLKEEAAQSERAAEGVRRDVEAQKGRVAALEAELEVERQAKLSAQESAGLSQLALQGLREELDASRAAHQAALSNLRGAEDRLLFLTSDEGRKEAIDSYRLGPIGKMEVTLAVKAGFDYLKAQLPPDAMPSPGPVYPPRVRGCLEMLSQLEKKGAAIRLEEEKEDGDEEDEEDEDEEGEDGEGSGDGDGST